MNIIERLRKRAVEGLFDTDTVNNCWSTWKGLINNHIGSNPTALSILGLSDHLRNIYQSTGSSGRSQSDLSGGGTAWESLVTWYVNLCCAGSRVVALKKIGQVPIPIRDAITVNYSSFSCASESDITIIVFPDENTYTDDNTFAAPKNGIAKKRLNEAVGNDFSRFQVGIIQCKTNWNDNAQIPMLWDMIYSAGGFRGRQISVGKNGFSIQQIPFSYAFVTVPTNSLDNYGSDKVCVKRVSNLSGGNYWGLPSENDVARSLKEIFQNYVDGYEHQDIKRTLANAIPLLSTDLSYFNL